MINILNNSSPQYLLALRGPEAHRKFLNSLHPKAKAKLPYKWRGWLARRSQLAPEGDWRVWLILAGRGWGRAPRGWCGKRAFGGRRGWERCEGGRGLRLLCRSRLRGRRGRGRGALERFCLALLSLRL